MLKNKTRLFLLFSLVLITMVGISAISAADIESDTVDISTDTIDIQTDTSVVENSIIEVQTDTSYQIDANDNNNLIQTYKNNTKELKTADGESAENITITESTYSQYFDGSGTPNSNLSSGLTVILSGDFTNKNFTINIPLTITSTTGANLINSSIVFTTGSDNSNLTNITITNTNYDETVIKIFEATNIKITDNTITQYNDEGKTHAIVLNKTSGNTIENNVISIEGLSGAVEYDDFYNGIATFSAIQIYNGSENKINNNKISAKSTNDDTTDYNTVDGIEVIGAFVMDYDTYDFIYYHSDANEITDNNINVTGGMYAYAVNLGNFADDTVVTGNNINTTEAYYSNGVQISSSSNNEVKENTIKLEADSLAYGIIVQAYSASCTDNTIDSNTITVSSNDAYGIEFYAADENTINNNTITVTGNYSMGIGTILSDDNTITANKITITGDSSATRQYNFDSVGQDTVGILIKGTASSSGRVTYSTGNEISENTITVTDLAETTSTSSIHAISLNKTNDTLIEDNNLYIEGLSSSINYDENFNGITTFSTLQLFNSTYTVINNNNITAKSTNDDTTDYNTVEAIEVTGNSNFNEITSNTVNVTGGMYAYAMDLNNQVSNNTISDNIITATNNYYTNGIQLSDASNNNARDNTINLSSTNFAYGIIIDTYSLAENNTLDSNTITVEAKDAYGIELYNTNTNIINNNTISVTGDYTMGIAAALANNNEITSNTISTTGNTGATKQTTYDALGQANAGIVIKGTYDVATANIVTGNNISVTDQADSTSSTHGIILNKTTETIVEDNIVSISGNSGAVEYDDFYNGISTFSAIQLYNSSSNKINNNNITAKSTNDDLTDYNTVDGIEVVGAFVMDYDTYDFIYYHSDENEITNNNVELEGGMYAYGINVGNFADDTIITGNNITVSDAYYSNGVQISSSSYNDITENNINLSATSLAYGIIVQAYSASCTDNTIDSNTITVSSNDAYGIEFYAADENTINNNTITVTGNYSIGIGTVLSDDNSITNNTITTTGDSSATKQSNYDSVGQDNTGIFIKGSTSYSGSFIDTTGNTVTGNFINVTDTASDVDVYTVKVNGTTNEVTNNTLYSTTRQGDFSVNGSDDNLVQDNLPSNNINIESANVKTDTLSSAKITATLTDDEGNPVTVGNVTFTDENGDEIATVDVVNGTATIDYTNEEVGTYPITITYNQNGFFIENSTTINVRVVLKLNTTTVIDDITAVVNDTITITATVTDQNGKAVNSGRVVFKVNGVTLKDSQNNALYAQVVNGVASINYIVPKAWMNENTIITALFSGTSDHNPSSDDATVTVSKRTADITLLVGKDTVIGGDTITLTAYVTDNGAIVNGGKVIFKLNGQTLKDENGSVIYATVVDGIAQCTYTLPEGISAKDYTLTAVYSNSIYDRAETNTTLTVEKDNAHIVLTPQYTTKGNTATVITAEILSSKNTPVVGNTMVSIKVGGVTVKTLTAVNGVINTTIDTSSRTKDYYEIVIVIGENNRYTSDKATNVLIIE